LLRVVCGKHGEVMGQVVETDGGRTYRAARPLHPGKLFVSERRFLTRGLLGRRGRQLPEAREFTSVRLDSPEAERYTLSEDLWGQLPAWCRECRRESWISIDVLRKRRGEWTIEFGALP
jgi:hypothetical protein